MQSEPLTSGMVGQPIHFEYSHDFDGLAVTAVFTDGKNTVDVVNPGNECVIPHEVLTTVGAMVKVGVYAVRGDELVIPTVYANIGVVLKGADPSGDVSIDPTLPVWAQTQALIGNLSQIETETKDSLVAAINEVKQTADRKANAADLAPVATSGSYSDLTDKPTIPSVPTATIEANAAARHTHENKTLLDSITEALKTAWNTASEWVITNGANVLSHVSDGVRHITATERSAWNDKQDKLIAGGNITIAADGKTISATGGGSATIELDTTLTQSGKAADAKAVGDELAKINNTKTEEVTETVTVSSENVTLDSTAPSQTVNLAWNVPGGKTIPPFTNYYIEKSGISYPRAFDASGYTQVWSDSAGNGNGDTFVSGHQYFQAMYYRMDGDGSAVIMTGGLSSTSNVITPTNSMTVTGSGWIYLLFNPANSGQIVAGFGTGGRGTGTIDYLYCIDVTALQEAGTITATTVNELAELFGGLELIPGQNYEGSITSGMATLSITRDGATTTVDSGTATATVQGGDILSVEGGYVTFLLKVLREVYVDPIKVWAGKKWVAFGDSLTDESINADKKYYRYIEEKTGITVTVMGRGGTGYYKTYDSGTAYGQRMAQVPADADVITIFGSVNDWHTKNAGVAMGNASDTMEAGTLAGYINECIDVAIEKAPYAQIALVTPMDFKGLPADTLEGIANIIKAVAAYRQIKCLDLYHESGFRVRNPIFAEAYATDYSETAESYGHPNNLAHERLIAPEFMELLKRMLLTA